jgi:hypothetical protein
VTTGLTGSTPSATRTSLSGTLLPVQFSSRVRYLCSSLARSRTLSEIDRHVLVSVYCRFRQASPERMWARRTHLSKVGEVVNGTSVQDISPQRLREHGRREGDGEFLFGKVDPSSIISLARRTSTSMRTSSGSPPGWGGSGWGRRARRWGGS